MSAFYDQASLVVVPSGYKSGKIYAQKPLTTDGQLTFTRASTATRVNASGLIETVASGVPRLDYLGSSCPKILLEPSRTNYQLYSENSALWVSPVDGLTVAYNTTETADPFGTNNAEKVTAVSGNRRMFDALTNPSGAFTMSAFVKAGTGDVFLMRTTSASIIVEFNLTTLAITAAYGTGTITNYGNGWYRCTASTTSAIAFEVVQYQFLNDANEYMYFFGAQAENGAYATSYVKTEAAAVTRLTDAASKTGISSLIGQAEGTLYWEGYVTPFGDWNSLLSVEVIGAQFINLRLTTDNRIELGTGNLSTDFIITASTPAVAGTYYKIAGAYKSGQSVLYVNGVQIGTSATTFTTPTLSQFRFNVWDVFNEQKSMAQALLFKTRLTNAQLAELTTL